MFHVVLTIAGLAVAHVLEHEDEKTLPLLDRTILARRDVSRHFYYLGFFCPTY